MTPHLRQLRQRGLHVVCEGQALPTSDALHDVVEIVPALPIVLLKGPGLGCSMNERHGLDAAQNGAPPILQRELPVTSPTRLPSHPVSTEACSWEQVVRARGRP